MPTVPTSQRQIATAPLPGVRVQGTAPAEAFAPAPDLSGVARVAGDIAERERATADQIAVNGAEVQASELRGQLHSQITAQKGTNALGSLDTARQAWTDGVAKITDGLHGDRQKRLFQARAAQHWAELAGAAEQHTATEMRAEDQRTTTALLDMADRDAIDNTGDPAKLALTLDKKRAAIADYGRRQGWTPETIQNKTAEALSSAHLGVIEHLVNSGADLAARQYLDAHRADLTADALPKAEHLERAASVQGSAQRLADGIVAAHGSLSDALDAVPKDTDPAVREHAEERIRRTFLDRAANERETRAQSFQQASSILEQTQDLDKVPLSLRTQLLPSELASLQHRENQLRHPPEPGDDATFFRLMNMASLSAETRKEFVKENILKYPNLSDVQRRRLLSKQMQLSVYDERHPTTDQPYIAPAGPGGIDVPKPDRRAGTLEAAHLTPAPAEPKKKPTTAMLLDVQKHGAAYAEYLREHNYDIPANAHVVGATPAGPK